MNTIEELEYYCNELQPVGALMLTGEWGCGKTYLLNNVLTEKLKDTHVILRISLFGIETIEEVRKEVKKCWLYAFVELKEPISGMSEKVKDASKLVKTIVQKGVECLPGSIKSIANGVLSLDAIDFVKISPQMGEKKVVLIFDDLERANVSTSDLLGCINDYCENLHINTIVVANEENVKSSMNDKIEYDEIKEKIIQRTICYSPDYSVVVSSVIDNMVCKSDDSVSEQYKSLLTSNKEAISAIFSGASIDGIPLDQLVPKKFHGKSREELESNEEKICDLLKHRPHNIRSLKCAMQDFRRVYALLDEKQIENKEKWFFTYLSYVLCFRAGLVPENKQYGNLFFNENVSILYPGFYDDKFITSGIKQWIRSGEWLKDAIDVELDDIVNRDKAITPVEKVRTNRLLDMDEIDIRDGYPILLEKAYNGELELNDYINLLYNSCWARKYSIKIPDIDWKKVCEGIHKQEESMIHEGGEQPHHRRVIWEENKELFLPEEWNAYKMIDEFLSTNTLIFIKNKELYMSLIKTEPLNALIKTQNKRFDIFDVEMAEATADGFEKISNAEKSSFIDYFRGMWQVKICTQDYKIKEPADGFEKLKQRISKLLDKYKDEFLSVREVHAKNFLEVINNLIEEQKRKLEEI